MPSSVAEAGVVSTTTLPFSTDSLGASALACQYPTRSSAAPSIFTFSLSTIADTAYRYVRRRAGGADRAHWAVGMKTPDGMLVGHLDADFLNEMPFDQLKKLGSDMGIPVGKLKSRENIVNAIVEQECYVSAEEDAPDLSTEDPIV